MKLANCNVVTGGVWGLGKAIALRLARGFVGAIAGAIIGFIVEVLCFWDGPPEDGSIRLPIAGPSLGAGICLVFALLLGGVRLRGFVKHTTIGAVVGIIAGVLLGDSLFAAIMTSLDPNGDGLMGSKIFATYQRVGILFGIPVGAAFGVLAGIMYFALQRKLQTPAT